MFCYDLIAGRATEMGSLAEVVAAADTTFLSLIDGEIVSQAASEIAALADVAGKVVVDISSIGPGRAKQVAATLKAAGVTYIDAPVRGGFQGALKASNTIIWGGPKAEMDRHRAIIDVFCANAFHVGDEPGQGQAVKSLN